MFIGCAKIEWSVENDEMAANSFKLNHPEATVIFEDANTVLGLVLDGQFQVKQKALLSKF